MSVNTRRAIYAALTVLGFGLMVPLALRARAWEAEVNAGRLELGTLIDASGAGYLVLMAFAGILIASSFLYLALSTGYPKAWIPDEGERILCRRCGQELRFGLRRCPNCDQGLVW